MAYNQSNCTIIMYQLMSMLCNFRDINSFFDIFKKEKFVSKSTVILFYKVHPDKVHSREAPTYHPM